MKAIKIVRPGGPEVLKTIEVNEPRSAPGDLLVTVKATALNRADILQRMGRYPPPLGTDPDIPGLEFSGIVEQINPACGDFRPGDRVMGLLPGEGYAEKVSTPCYLAMPIPKHLSFEEAAAIPEVFLTAYDAVDLQLGMKRGETLLIHAVGSGVGTAALQLARVKGIRTIGTSSSDIKLNKAKELGLDLGINHLSEDLSEVLRGEIVDAILDLVGAIHWNANLTCLKACGRMVVVGLVGGRHVELDLGLLLRKRIKLIGTVLRSRTVKEKIGLIREFRENVLPLFEQERLKPIVDCVYDLEQAPAAHHYMEENRNFGKIVLKVGTGR
jgi:putative PIG3 family NAD(P)H quinone oxidoreductase